MTDKKRAKFVYHIVSFDRALSWVERLFMRRIPEQSDAFILTGGTEEPTNIDPNIVTVKIDEGSMARLEAAIEKLSSIGLSLKEFNEGAEKARKIGISYLECRQHLATSRKPREECHE